MIAPVVRNAQRALEFDREPLADANPIAVDASSGHRFLMAWGSTCVTRNEIQCRRGH